jgi:F-type H+-transporting ATPase subunit delta|tara:strand:- start:82 stop:615 length:534 start_codon:yes stop_codon:yes gene_type:complete
VARRLYAKRYAQAVFDIALESKELDRWQSDLRKVAGLGEDSTVIAFFENPKFNFEAKAKLLSKQLADINPLALNLVYLLQTRGRLSMVGDIADEYQRLLDSYHGIEPAEVITAVPLDDEDRLRLGERIGAVVGKKVVIKPEVDSSIIGGIIARIGGKLLDGSTRSKLEALKRELARR